MMINKIMILPLFFISLFIPISASSWILMWMGMEINMLMFIFLILMKKNMFTSESSMKYFLIQCSGSLIFLLSLSSNFIYFNEWPFINSLVPPMALMLKSGFAPFHSWMPEIIKNFNFLSLLFFFTSLKIPPFFMIFSSWFNIMVWISIINILIGSTMGIIQSSLIKMLIASSINNMGWMTLSLMISNFLFLIQFMIYFILMYALIKMMKLNKIKWISQINLSSFFLKMNFYMNLLSLAGMPPFLGFLPKWMIIKKMMMNAPIIISIFILMTIFNLFFYIKSCINMMFLFKLTKKWMIFYKNTMINLFFMLNLNGITMFILLT
uniref:NADH-ubiquinone oxidoreductase chain 2 n=1 Tax=Mycopsylla proxima TaxID=1681221 RepID=A0A343UQT0_9HEMI|nr:NADH dehydrogenase subunit 2 [Mycopsylla proxima]AVF97055.1 NADH dehydrogenase subunit 2 [Mycopsylla proxima]